MLSKMIAFVGVLSACVPYAAADLGYKVDYPNGLHPVFDPNLTKNLHAPTSKTAEWAAGKIPQSCKDSVSGSAPKCAINNMLVYNVTYADCSMPWVFCRCSSADLSLATMVDLFGKMPVNMRSLIRTLIALPDTAPNAYSVNYEIVIQGNANTESVFLHETGHHLDAQGLTIQNSKPEPGFTTTAAWLNAFEADTCVPDSYANTNQQENFAQETVVEQYWIVDGNTIPKEAYVHCLHNQRKVLEDNFRKGFMTPGSPATCGFRYANSPVVSTSSKREAEAEAMAELEERSSGIRIIDLAEQSTMNVLQKTDPYYPFGKPAKKMIRGMARN